MIPVRRLSGRPLVMGGIAAVALASGAGVTLAVTSGGAEPAAAAATAASQASPSPAPSAPKRQVLPWHGPLGKLGFGPGLRPGLGAFGAVHGQFVVPKDGGGYQTVDTQRGSVTAVSATSITVKSSDGFSKTYQVSSDTIVDAHRDGISSIKTGQQVAITATASGSTVTASNIIDMSAFPKEVMPHWKHAGWRGGPGGSSSSPAPAGTSGWFG
jgi:hypothetical protein